MKHLVFISYCVKYGQTIFAFLYRLFVPIYCVYCKKFGAITSFALCDTCARHIPIIATIDIAVTKKVSIPVFAASSYEYPVKMLILAKQYQQIFACKALAELIWERTDIRFCQEFDLIVPIPLHWKRYAKRGYNQAEEIAQVLGQKMNLPVVNLLQRTRQTAFQLTLSKEDRATNVAGVFALAKKEYKDLYQKKRILLVDDLLTTGSTMINAGNVLLELNPIYVKAAVGARVL